MEHQLYDAAGDGRLGEVIQLSSHEFSRNVRVLSVAFHCSCKNGQLVVAKWLAEHTRADVDYVIRSVMSSSRPLVTACYNGKLDIVKYLLKDSRVNVNLNDCNFGLTPLSWASSKVNTPLSMIFLQEASDELDVNIVDNYGNTALHYTIWCRTSYKLHEACDRNEMPEVMRLIYEDYFSINEQDNWGNTPLHFACRDGRREIIEVLMVIGADETITNDKGLTPEVVAQKGGYNEVVELLNRVSLQRVLSNRLFHGLIPQF